MIDKYLLENSLLDGYLLEDESGVLLLESLLACCNIFTGGSPSGNTVLTIGEQEGEGLLIQVFDKIVDLHTTPSQKWSIGFTLPSNCVLVMSQFHLLDNITSVSGAIAVSFGKEDPGDETEGGQTTNLSAGQQTGTKPGFWLDEKDDDLVNRNMYLFATNGSGILTGSIGGGSINTERIRVRMVYLVRGDLL